MLDVLSLTMGDQEEASVQANQLVGQLLPGHLLLLHVSRSMIALFSLILFSTCETYVSTSSLVLVSSDRTKNVIKFDRFQIFHMSRDTKSALMRPETQTFQCHGAITEESKIPFAQPGINFAFGTSLSVSRVCNDDHFVVHVHVLQQEHFVRTHLNKSLNVVVLKWNV